MYYANAPKFFYWFWTIGELDSIQIGNDKKMGIEKHVLEILLGDLMYLNLL